MSHGKSPLCVDLTYQPAVGRLLLGLPLEAMLKESNAGDIVSDSGNLRAQSHVFKLSNWWFL